MKDSRVTAMKASSPIRKPTKGKPISGSILNGEKCEKDKKGSLVAPKGRRASVDSAFLGVGKMTLSCHREKSNLSDTSETKPTERRNSYSSKKDRDKSTGSKEGKYSFNKTPPGSKHSDSSKSLSPVDLKPILKTCNRLSNVHQFSSLEDIPSKQEDKLPQPQESVASRFCYRLPLTQTARKSVSFRDDVLDECRHRPRRYSSPSLQFAATSFPFSSPASKQFNEAMQLQDESVS